MAERIWNAAHPDQIAAVFGTYDANLNTIQKQFHVVIVNRGTGVKITGAEEDVEKAAQAPDAAAQFSGRCFGHVDFAWRQIAVPRRAVCG